MSLEITAMALGIVCQVGLIAIIITYFEGKDNEDE